MPGPVALKKQQFYGFDGNHFWHILPTLFGLPRPPVYEDRLALLKKNRVALWDVLYSCRRKTALDAHIRDIKPNKIPQLLKKHPNIRAVFINGRYAYDTFHKSFEGKIKIPVFYLPSTSPAHAAMTLAQKTRKWAAIKKYLA
jgi:hypoxanthine-DNA glycosylase